MTVPAQWLQPVVDGTHVMADESGGRLRIWVSPRVVLDTDSAEDRVYVFEADHKDGHLDVFRLELWPLSGVPTGFPEWVIPVITAGTQVVEAIGLIRAALAVRARLLAKPFLPTGVGAETFATGDATLVAAPPLGLVSVSGEGGVSQAYAPLMEIARALVCQPSALPGPRAPSPRESLARTLSALAVAQEALDQGAMLSGGGQRFLRRAGRTLVLQPWQLEDPATLLQRPQGYCDPDLWKIADALPLTPLAVPDALLRVLPAVEVKLGRSRQQVIDAMVADVRRGHSVSGGPTTDQRWTLSFSRARGARGGFRMTGANPDGERTDDPITEAAVREMFATYRMFGLDREGS